MTALRLGLNREEAAEAVGVSPNVFDRMVRAGEMPQPHRSGVCNRLFWRVRELDQALASLPTEGAAASKPVEVDF